jgi:hypothetical protein
MGDLFGVLVGIGLIILCLYVRKWRSEEYEQRCPNCGNMTNANGSSSGMRQAGGGYIHNYHCKSCGHKWSN